MLGIALALVACGPTAVSPTRSQAQLELPVDEIEGGVTPPGSRVVNPTGGPRRDAPPEQLLAAGDYFYRSGELGRAREFYAACSGSAEGSLRAACQWGIGATLVAAAREAARWQAHEDRVRDQALGLRPRQGLVACTSASAELRRAVAALRIAHRIEPTARRARIIATLDAELGDAVECRARDCPALPFGWHHRSEELEVLGSGIEGSSRERVFACYGAPGSFSSDTWIYSSTLCTSSVVITLRIHFDADVVDRVTHERSPMAHDCPMSTTF